MTTTMTRPTATAPERTDSSPLTGTWALVRFILRRDRIRIPVWIVALTVSLLGSVASFPEVYATAQDRQNRADLLGGNAGAAFLTGPGYGLENYTFGAMTANEMGLWMMGALALMSILLVSRHLRAEEESGRAELVRAAVVGRHASLTATLIVVGTLNVLLGLIFALGLPESVPNGALPTTSSVLFGAAIAAVGLVFTAVAAATNQLTQHSRGATGMAVGLLGLAILLRAAGDIGDGTLSWVSPIGWAQRTGAYVIDRWWPLLLAAALAVLVTWAAYVLSTRRDVGFGMIQSRRGPAHASSRLSGPFGLALRLQRGILLGWGAGVVFFGFGIGSILDQAAEFLGENESVRDILAAVGEAPIVDSTIATYMFFLALVTTGYAIQGTMYLRSEEAAGRVEPLLGTPLPRLRWFSSHLAVALVGSTAIVALAGLGAGLTFAAASSDAGDIPRVMTAAVVHLPALWVLIGLTVAVVGLAPRATGLVWAFLAAILFVGMFGPLLRLPDWVMDVSPFGHVPQIPAQDFTATPLIVLTAIAVALTAIGMIGYRRRDLTLS